MGMVWWNKRCRLISSEGTAQNWRLHAYPVSVIFREKRVQRKNRRPDLISIGNDRLRGPSRGQRPVETGPTAAQGKTRNAAPEP